LLGQLLGQAHSRTSGAIKELLISAHEFTLVIEGSDKVISVHDIKRRLQQRKVKNSVDGKLPMANHYRRIYDFG
jgi:hypothetical protein